MTREQEIFSNQSKYDLTIRMLQKDDFDLGFDDLVPYESAERRADPKISLKYLISGQRIANDFDQFKNWWVKYAA